MKLAKNHLDLGLFSKNISSDLDFWQKIVGLDFEETLSLDQPVVPGPTTQHRHNANGSVIKINDFQDIMPYSRNTPSGLKGLSIARDISIELNYETNSGEFVRVLPKGRDGIQGIAVTIESENPSRLENFYVKVMQFESIGPLKCRCGDTVLILQKGAGATETKTFVGEGFRYLTIQVFDAVATCNAIKKLGGRIAMEPIWVGEIAKVGFALDPDGNWLEISARASLTGISPTK